MIFKAFYNIKPLVGCIRISQLDKGSPAEYTLAVVQEINGLLSKKKFETYEEAAIEASSHGCVQSKWDLVEY